MAIVNELQAIRCLQDTRTHLPLGKLTVQYQIVSHKQHYSSGETYLY